MSTPEQQPEKPALGDSTTESPNRVSANPRTRRAAPRARKTAKTLIDTSGPDPSSQIRDVRLAVGRIAGTHGVRGELKLRVLTDHPEHLPTVRKIFLGDADTPTTLESVRFHGDLALIKLAGIDSPEEGRKLGGLTVRIAGEDAKPLEEGEYFLFQLIGLRAVDESGAELGVVRDLMETGANDVLVISGKTGEMLVPNHPEFVMRIAPEEQLIVIKPPQYAN